MAGLQVLYELVKGKFNDCNDAIVCCLHWFMVENHGFRCVGLGETVPASVEKSELLPDQWNSSPGFYALLYQPEDSDKTHLLKIIAVNGSLLVHLLRLHDEKVTNMNIKVSEYVNIEYAASFKRAYKNLEELKRHFEQELINSLKSTTPQIAADQRARENDRQNERRRNDDDDDPLRVPGRGSHANRQPRPEWSEHGDPFAVGRGDLDPLAGGMGGGMLMDPRRGFPGGAGLPDYGGPNMPGRLPRGAVPPGARFDPFGPPDLDPSGGGNLGNPNSGRRSGPNPDHLPPPGYDDMFM